MILLDALLRFSGLGLMLFVSVLILRDARESRTAALLLLLNISTASHFLGFTPDTFALPIEAQMILRSLDVFQMYLAWLLTLSLFEKDFKLNGIHVLVGVVYCVPVFMERLVQFNFIDQLPIWWAGLVNGTTLVLVLHMLSTAILGRSDDLIEARRVYRIHLVLIVAVSAVAATLFGSILYSQQQATIDVVSIWPAIVWLSFWVVGFDTNILNLDSTTKRNLPRDTLNGRHTLSGCDALSSRDAELLKRLDSEVVGNKAFLNPKLCIDDLAKSLGVSEYRLRGFINQTLGHTNFSTYINGYRIAEIKQQFADPNKQHIPVLTIALNNGFNSLAPFNRAFKQTEGLTPTQYRATQLKP